jgi:hypothetical protein
VAVHPETESRLVANGPQQAGRVLDEAQVVEHADRLLAQVAKAAEEVVRGAEVFGLERRRHRVDREVSARKIVSQGRALDLGKGAGSPVELGARRGHVDAHLAAAVSSFDDRRLELLVRMGADTELARQVARERERVPLDHDVEIEALLAEQHVSDSAAHQIHALVGGSHGLDGRKDLLKPLDLTEARSHRIACLLARPWAFERQRLVQRTEHVPARDHALGAAGGHLALGPVGPVGHYHQPLGASAGEQITQLAERRLPAHYRHARAHHGLDRRVAQAMADGTVQVLACHDAGEPPVVGHLNPAESQPLTLDQRRRDVGGAGNEVHRARHHIARTQRRLRHAGHLGKCPLQDRAGVPFVNHRGGGLRMPASTDRRQGLVDRKGGSPASPDDERPFLHGDAEQQRVPVGDLPDARHQGRDVFDIRCAPRCSTDDSQPFHFALLTTIGEKTKQFALLRLERAPQVACEELLVGACSQAGGKRFDVALGRRGVGQRSRVLVNAEREGGCLHRRDGNSPLEQEPQHGRHDAAVLGRERCGAVERLVAVVIEDDDLHVALPGEVRQVAEPGEVRHLDEHQPPDGVPVERRGLDARDHLRVQIEELAHVAVDPTVKADACARV